MKLITKRGDEPQEVNKIDVLIDNTTYRITESVDGKLSINKTTKDGNESLMVFPRYSNEIELL